MGSNFYTCKGNKSVCLHHMILEYNVHVCHVTFQYTDTGVLFLFIKVLRGNEAKMLTTTFLCKF